METNADKADADVLEVEDTNDEVGDVEEVSSKETIRWNTSISSLDR